MGVDVNINGAESRAMALDAVIEKQIFEAVVCQRQNTVISADPLRMQPS